MDGSLYLQIGFSFLFLCSFVGITSGNSNITRCKNVYEFENATDTYEASCSVLQIGCSGFHAVPNNCEEYFQCVHRLIYQCPCASGTKFDRELEECVHEHEADCSCPPKPTPDETTSTFNSHHKDKETSDDKRTLIAVVISVLLSVLAVVVIALVIFFRRKSNPENDKKQLGNDLGEPYYISISDTYACVDSKSQRSSKKSAEGYLYPKTSKDLAPPLPDRPDTLNTEIIYDNNASMATDNMADTYEEKVTISDADTKRETLILGVENEVYGDP